MHLPPQVTGEIVHEVAVRGLRIRGHRFDLPLDHDRPDGDGISVFAREIAPADDDRNGSRPWLLFLQGGPGGMAPRPARRDGWVGAALDAGFRVLLLDQRGTGLSTPATARSLAALGPEAQASYLAHHRADAIVRDAEGIRVRLTGGEPWSVLGQSYGGFCTLSYLSLAPQGVREALVAGGLSHPWSDADAVYRACYAEVLRRNDAFFARYPAARERVQRVAERLPAPLPDGGTLSVRRFQALGTLLGASDGFERLAYLLERALVSGPGGPSLSEAFVHAVASETGFHRGPLYAALHESIYAQGAPTDWAAARLRAEFPAFDDADAVRFTGEMIYPWMFDEVAELRGLAGAAHRLAAKTDWGPLYDPERLARNEVPLAAAVYYDDMYVPRELSLDSARRIPGVRTWVTNAHEHDALRVGGAEIFERLLGMVRGRV